MRLVCLGGFMDGYWGLPSMKKDMEGVIFDGQKPLIIRAPNRLHNWSRRTDRFLLDNAPRSEYFVLGFSDGAAAAMRMMNQDNKCRGIIFISGLYEEPKFNESQDIAYGTINRSLILNTVGEKQQIVDNCYRQYVSMRNNMYYVERKETKVPGNPWFPHLLGIRHHFKAIHKFFGDIGLSFTYSRNLGFEPLL